MDLKLHIIIGSTRPGRVGPSLATWLHSFAIAHGKFSSELVDLAKLGPPLLDEANYPISQNYEQDHSKRWSNTVAAADAFLFLTPEYDYFPPAVLVNAVQCLFVEWAYKAAGIVSYGGVSAGCRASQMLRLLLTSTNVFPLAQTVAIPDFTQFFDENAMFRADARTESDAALMLDELFKIAGALKTIR